MGKVYNSIFESFTPSQPLGCRKIISIKQKQAKYIAKVKDGDRRRSVVFDIDGVVVKSYSTPKCDNLIVVDSTADCQDLELEYFVELKGCRIGDAIGQLEATFKYFNKKRNDAPSQARIVGRSFPSNSGNKEVEAARNNFRKNYNCTLRILKSENMEVV